MSLNFEIMGSGPRVVLAHGFTQNKNCWGTFAESLAKSYEVVVVDLPGHGDSLHDEASLQESAELLTEVGGKASYIGYSMGGRICLHAALTYPDLVNSLVLIGVNPGIENLEERRNRKTKDSKLAEKIIEKDLNVFLTDWLSQDLFKNLSNEAQSLQARLLNRVEGIAATLLNRGVGSQDSLWSQLQDLTMPVLQVVGSNDSKYLDISQKAAELFINSDRMIVSGGHAAHLESEQVVNQIKNWLSDK